MTTGTWRVRQASREKGRHANIFVRGVSPQDRAGIKSIVVCDSGGVWLHDVEAAGIGHLEPLRPAEITLEVTEVAHCRRGGRDRSCGVDWVCQDRVTGRRACW